MATYEIKGDDGATYHIDGPENASDADLISAVHGTTPAEAKPGFLKQMGLDLYHSAPEIAGNTIGSIAAAPFALAAGAVHPAAGFAVESAGAGLGQGIGSLAKSAVQNGANLVQSLRGKEPAFPDAPSTTGDILKTAGTESLKGAAAPAVGKAVGLLGKGAAAVGEGLTGKPAEEITKIFNKPSIMLTNGKQAVQDAYKSAKAGLGLGDNSLSTIAERASTPGRTAEYSAQEIANPVIAAMNNNVELDAKTLIGGKEALSDLYKSAPKGSQIQASYADQLNKVNQKLDTMAKTDPAVKAYRDADALHADTKIGDNFHQIFPDVSLNKSSLGKMLGSNALIAGAAHASPVGLAALPFESPAVTGTTAALAGLAKKGVEAVPAGKESLRAALSKLLTR